MTSFNVNCTLPSTQVNYVSGANVRGTLDILWSSLSIITLCTWSIQHLNVPIQSRPQTRRQKIGLKLLLFERKVRWMLINVIVPEVALGKASSDLATAKLVTPELANLAKQDNVDWTLAHSFYAGMGGFAIRFPDNIQEKAEKSKEKNDEEATAAADDESTNIRNSLSSHRNRSDEENQLQQTQSTNSSSAGQASLQISSESEAGAVAAKTDSSDDGKSEVQRIKIRYTELGVPVDVTNMPAHLQMLVFNEAWKGLDAFECLIKNLQPWIGHVDWKIDRENRKTVLTLLESVTHSTLDRRKIGWFYNVLPLQGNVWVPDASQLLYARKQGIIDSLPCLPTERLDDLSKTSSMLKLITLVQIIWLILQLIVRRTENLPSIPLEIAVLAFAVVSLVTYTILWSKPQDIQTCFYTTAAKRPSLDEVDNIGFLGVRGVGPLRSHPWIPSNYLQMRDHSGRMFGVGLVTATFLFGGLHCLAWNSHFPTPIERLLWRISSIYITACIIPSAILGVTFLALERISKTFKQSESGLIFNVQEVTFSTFTTLITVGYVICRLYLTVEYFRSLFFSPPGAFVDTDWPSYLPHLT